MRVPDTFGTNLLSGKDKGSSPWFFNNYKKSGSYADYGFSQAFPFSLKGAKANNNSQTEKLYPGKFVKKYAAPAATVGWEFNFDGSLFNIGNFGNTGVRGRLGGNDWFDRYDLSNPNYRFVNGLWTASMGDLQSGYAIALEMSSYNTTNGAVSTAIGYYPQAAMGVRCAKDLPRYIISSNAMPENGDVTLGINVSQVKSDILLFPNPTSSEVFVNKKVRSFKLFDLSGKMLQNQERKQAINMAPLPDGEYIIILTTDEGETVSKKIIKK